jgi:hypothetical protein
MKKRPKLRGIRVPGFVESADGTKIVEDRAKRLAKLDVSARIAAKANEKKRIRFGKLP